MRDHSDRKGHNWLGSHPKLSAEPALDMFNLNPAALLSERDIWSPGLKMKYWLS